MNNPTLHPNLAKLAAAYDEILARYGRGQITAVAARAEIAQLEARDDQGVRWSLDPDTGEWVRKTALGDFEYDSAPPTYGYMTPDAFDYTHSPQVFNPSDRVQLAEVTEQLERPPTGLAGASRARVVHASSPLAPLLQRLSGTSTAVRVAAAAVFVVVLAFLLHACSGSTASPSPSATGGGAPAAVTGTSAPAGTTR